MTSDNWVRERMGEKVAEMLDQKDARIRELEAELAFYKGFYDSVYKHGTHVVAPVVPTREMVVAGEFERGQPVADTQAALELIESYGRALSTRQLEALALLQGGEEMVCEKASCWVENERFHIKTENALLRACAISDVTDQNGILRRYVINETGRRILANKLSD